MAAKNPLLLVLLLVATMAWTQDDDEDSVVGQTISWDEIAGAQTYEVQVLAENGTEVFRQSVEVPQVSLRLPPGLYRYQIRVYNVLDQLENESPWTPMPILRAEIPRPREFSPSLIYLEDTLPHFRVRGSFLKEGATVTIIRQDHAELVAVGKVTARVGEQEFSVDFPHFEFAVGDYDLLVQNPGGLKRTLKGALQVRFSKPFDLRLAVGWSPAIPVGDPWFTNNWKGFAPLGATSRFDLILLKRAEDQAGVGLEGSVLALDGGLPAAVVLLRQASGGASLLYNLLVAKNYRIGARLGGGLTASWYHFDYEGVSGSSWASLDPYASAELDVSYWFNRWVYVETGAAWVEGFNNGYQSSLIKPVLLVGASY